MEREIVSIREFAKRVNVSDTLIRKAIKLEKVNYVRTGSQKGIDYLQGLEEIKSFGIGATKNPNSDGVQEGDFNVQTAKFSESKRVSEFYKAELNRIQFEQESGKLVRIEDLSIQLSELMSSIKKEFESMPVRAAGKVHAIIGGDLMKITEIILKEVGNSLLRVNNECSVNKVVIHED